MSSVTLEVNKMYDTLNEQALEQNDRSYGTWFKYKNELGTSKSLLNFIPKNITHQVMVPLGPKALMPGEIVNTNEFLVNLGETWFVERTSSQTIEICDRRIKTCDEMLQKLKRERELVLKKSTSPAEQEAFGNEERPEIIGYVTEEEDREWRKQHKLKEEAYQKKLSELRNRRKNVIESEEDLDQPQEELEDELNWLNAYNSSDDDVSESSHLDSSEGSDEPSKAFEKTNYETDNKSENLRNFKIKIKVSFPCNANLSDEESNKEKELENIQHEESLYSSDEDFIEEVMKPVRSRTKFSDVIEGKTVSVENARKLGGKISIYSSDEDLIEEVIKPVRSDVIERKTVSVGSTRKPEKKILSYSSDEDSIEEIIKPVRSRMKSNNIFVEETVESTRKPEEKICTYSSDEDSVEKIMMPIRAELIANNMFVEETVPVESTRKPEEKICAYSSDEDSVEKIMKPIRAELIANNMFVEETVENTRKPEEKIYSSDEEFIEEIMRPIRALMKANNIVVEEFSSDESTRKPEKKINKVSKVVKRKKKKKRQRSKTL